MCGINLAIGLPERVIEMNNHISHRGEIKGYQIYDNIGLGSIRLPIQGLNKKFNMPFKLDNGDILLYNGEIYNYKELVTWKEPESDIECFNNPTGTHPENFDGDFAYILFNSNNQEITVVTDRFGKRQLYYKIENDYITGISSEIKGLLEGSEELNEHYFQTTERFKYVHNSKETYIKNIFRFMPGYKYTVNDSGQIINKQKINWNSSNLVPKNIAWNLKDLIELSIKRRLISDVPIAFLYSGGLDSSIILYYLKKLKTNVKIFTIENADDYEYAERYAKELGFEIEKIQLDKTDELKAMNASELQTDLGSTLQNYNLFKQIKKHGYKVVLTGDAADEVFRGYKRNLRADHIYNDIFNELIYYHFPRLDKLAMAHTVEYRSPYSADYIIDVGLIIPYIFGKNKKILREIYKGEIPNYILDRKKVSLKR